jgi:hypothetical protein
MEADKPTLLTQALETEELQETWVNTQGRILDLSTTLILEELMGLRKEALWSPQVG